MQAHAVPQLCVCTVGGWLVESELEIGGVRSLVGGALHLGKHLLTAPTNWACGINNFCFQLRFFLLYFFFSIFPSHFARERKKLTYTKSSQLFSESAALNELYIMRCMLSAVRAVDKLRLQHRRRRRWRWSCALNKFSHSCCQLRKAVDFFHNGLAAQWCSLLVFIPVSHAVVGFDS